MSENDTLSQKVSEPLFAVTRIALGWIMFWAFIDKTFGLAFYSYQGEQFGTPQENSWIAGGSPTSGFLQFGTSGKWFGDMFQAMAGSGFIDFLFMLGLFGSGIAMMTGAGRKLGGIGGALLMLLMWLASLPLGHNPFVDDHLMYMFLFLIFGLTENFGRKYSLADWWKEIAPHPILE